MQRQQVDQRLAARLRRADRQAIDLHLVDHAARGEEQNRRVRGADEDLADEVLLAGRHAGAAFPAALLGPIGRERNPFDVATVGHRDDHVLALDQVLVGVLAIVLEDFGAARRGEAFFHIEQLAPQDLQQPLTRSQDLQVVDDLLGDLLQLLGDLVTLEARQSLQPQL